MKYAEWKATKPFNNSFDCFRREFPEVKEYQVFALDPNTKMSHIDGEPLLETDSAAEACVFIYNAFKNEGLELCVYQQRNNGYCDYYRKSNKHTIRGKNGRFVKV